MELKEFIKKENISEDDIVKAASIVTKYAIRGNAKSVRTTTSSYVTPRV